MTASLNVEENLLFSARYRLPATATPAQHRAQVRNSNITCPACTGLSCTQALCTPPPPTPMACPPLLAAARHCGFPLTLVLEI